jgi:hypothetical protein
LGLILFCDADFSDDLEAFEPYLPYQLKMTQADALRYAFFLLKKAEFSMTKMPSYKLRLNELTEIEANLKENGDALTGYQFNTFFSLYKKDITPYTILSFFQSLFKMLLSDKDKRRKIDDELLATAMTEAIIKEE